MDKKRQFISLISVLFSIILMSAFSLSSDWRDYGGNYTWHTHAQINSAFANYNYQNGQLVEMAGGYEGSPLNSIYEGKKPIVSDFSDGTGEKYFLFTNYGNLFVLDKNLNYVAYEYPSNSSITATQLYSGDLNNDGFKDEIAGLWRMDENTTEYRVYSFSPISLNFTLLLNYTWYSTDYPIALYEPNNNGVNCVDGINSFCAYGLSESNNFTMVIHYFNGTIIQSSINTNFSLQVSEPVQIGNFNQSGTEIYIFSPLQFTGMFYNLQAQKIRELYYDGDMSLMYFPDGYSSKARVVNVYGSTTSNAPKNNCYQATTSYYLNGSIAWQNNPVAITNGCFDIRSGGIAIADYNMDSKDDVWVAYTLFINPSRTTYGYIYSGDLGNTLESFTFPTQFTNSIFDNRKSYSTPTASISEHSYPQQFSLARMNSDNKYDWILPIRVNELNIYYHNGSVMQYYLRTISNATTQYSTSCVTADLDEDTYNDIICSANSYIAVVYSNYSNTNAYVDTITFSPSQTIGLSDTLNVNVTCLDNESDTIYYSYRCDSTINFSSDSLINLFNCNYGNFGAYSLTARCRDSEHGEYNSFSTTINVVNGTIITPITSGVSGGASIPIQLVDLDNQEAGNEKGLLPEIYYGFLAFISATITPTIFIIFAIFGVLILLAIFKIIKNVLGKI